MALSNRLRKGIHRKVVEILSSVPISPASGAIFLAGPQGIGFENSQDRIFVAVGTNSIYSYNALEDGWQLLPASAITGTWNAGNAGESMRLGFLGGSPTSTLTGGTTTTMVTARTIVRRLTGVKVRVVSGTGSGYEGTITNNTLGANSVLTVTPASSVAFDATTTVQVYSGSLWIFCGGGTVVGFSVYDLATGVWTAKSVAGISWAASTTGQLISTRSSECLAETGTATSATSTTLVCAGKGWIAGCWANYQVRIVSGTGAGQVRTIASNNVVDTLTVATAWTVNPDATSVFNIEANDDYMYLMGGGGLPVYRYTISTNSWAAMTYATTARVANFSPGTTADWISNYPGASVGSNTDSNIRPQHGRYIYSFRGAASSLLDVFDIASNNWVNGVPYGNAGEALTGFTNSVYDPLSGRIILMLNPTAGRFTQLNLANHTMNGFFTHPMPGTTTTMADYLAIDSIYDGTDYVSFLYIGTPNAATFTRLLMV